LQRGVGNVLRRHGLPSAPARKHTTTWAAFIRVHLAVLAGTDFFTVEVLTLRGLVTYYVLFFINLESRKVEIAGITIHPNEQWMQQMARNVTMEGCGTLRDCRYLLHDRDTKYTISFRAIIESGRVKTLPLPARSPNLNAYAERWVRSVKEECLSKIIVFGERLGRQNLPPYDVGPHLNGLPGGVIINARPGMNLSEATNTLKAPSALFGDAFLHSLIAPAAFRAGEVHRDLRSAGHPGNMRPESGICHTGCARQPRYRLGPAHAQTRQMLQPK
jgi:hypothetical protein